MTENMKQAITAAQSAILTTLGQNATKQNCVEIAELLAHTLLTGYGQHDKKTSFHNLDILYSEIVAMIEASRGSNVPHH